MNDPMGLPHELREHDRVEHYLIWAGKAMAISGGLLFVALIGMSLVSIVGRKLGFGSVNGDIELMQAGTAVAAMAFLPYCTLLGEHIKVDFFTENMGAALKDRIDGLAELLLALACAALLWRTSLAALDAHESGETTTLVGLPLWIPISLLLPSLLLMVISAGYRAYAHWHPAKQVPRGAQ
ncbi:MAG: TRAP transporter small permease subunit [Proteobacteria bacterium]|nr:TRAP transporter small permease subunit [Pseudomonadota bacterium]MBS0492415.1 TRAP transporter small permease subunit [Pseudomonadota bacterium]